MAYAANERISQSPIEGGVEISEAEYVAARSAMLAGQEVAVIGDEMVLRDPAPSPDHTWDDGKWVAPEQELKSPPMPSDVKEEARRRILSIMPEHDQRNYTAMATDVLFELRETGRELTTEEQALLADGRAKFDQIKAIRAASDQIEVMDPIPDDFTDDSRWP